MCNEIMHVKPLRSLFRIFCFLLVGNLLSAQTWSATNQALDDQLVMLARDIQKAMQNDRLLQGQQIQHPRAKTVGVPMANIDQYIEQTLAKHLSPILNPASRLELTVECTYLVSESNTNSGRRVLQLTARILQSGRPKLVRTSEADLGRDGLVREVNNSTDIGRALGVTYVPPDSSDHQARLDAAEQAFENPTYKTVNNSQISAPGKPHFAVEVLRKPAGAANFTPVLPHSEQGWAFAPIQIGDVYQLALYNFSTATDVVAKIEIDGLDVATTFSIDKDASGQALANGYVIPRSVGGAPGKHIVPGWMHTIAKSDANVYEFVVNELGKGAASALKARGNIGVITVRFFEACHPNEDLQPRSFGETGIGQARHFDYHKVDLKYRSEPDSIVSIRYNRS